MSNSILGLVPTIQSIALAEHNLNYLKSKKKKKKLVRQGVENIVGISLVKETADFLS